VKQSPARGLALPGRKGQLRRQRKLHPEHDDLPADPGNARGARRQDRLQHLNDVYETVSLDYLYPNPSNLVLFEGNHDTPRIYSVVNEDYARYQMDLVFVMTMPRIPHFYSGDEILMTSATKERNDSSYREDFPGGWAGDKVN